MAMVKCNNCGRTISDAEKMCPYCEEKIESKPNCPKCQSNEVEFSLLGKTGIYECKQCRYKYTVSRTGEVREYVGAKVEDFNILTAFLNIYKKIFDFKGRASRKEYWLAQPLFVLIFFVLYALTFVSIFAESAALAIFSTLVIFAYALVTGVGMLAMTIRRLHDTGRAWYSIFVSYIPFVGQFILLYYTIEDSQVGPNEYGPNPKGKE